jgi:hypothetical protein
LFQFKFVSVHSIPLLAEGAAPAEAGAAAAGKSFVFQIFIPHTIIIYILLFFIFAPYYISSCALLNFFYTITHLKIF